MNQSWFLMALVPPLLYAVTNHIDRNLLGIYFKEGGVGTLVIVSSLLSVIPIPIFLWVDSSVLSVGIENMPALAFAGLLNVGLIWFYLKAMQDEEPTVVIIFYSLVPVLGLVFGYFILDETISHMQLIAMAIIIVGTALVSFEIGEANNLTLRVSTLVNMVIACTCWALEMVVLKKVALEENMWRSLFWEHSMMVVVGILIFIFVPKYRYHFMIALRSNSKAILSLNATNEVLYIIGNVVGAFASMMAPVALVLLAQPFQSIFVFGIAVFLTSYFPRFSAEKTEFKHMLQKLLAICVTGMGTYLLLTS
ncbi:MAG: DMT family transporter [Candidatus Pacebacteria bacterium]|nr:DMT family transporter [Candidatus Paceibacterota bacterium]MCF7857085.1 DMT family transporter [Candidatus Paceibacterota bacterium]